MEQGGPTHPCFNHHGIVVKHRYVLCPCSSDIDLKLTLTQRPHDHGLGRPRASTFTNVRVRRWAKGCRGLQGLRRRPSPARKRDDTHLLFLFYPLLVLFSRPTPYCTKCALDQSPPVEPHPTPSHSRKSQDLKHIYRLLLHRGGNSPHTNQIPSGCPADLYLTVQTAMKGGSAAVVDPRRNTTCRGPE